MRTAVPLLCVLLCFCLLSSATTPFGKRGTYVQPIHTHVDTASLYSDLLLQPLTINASQYQIPRLQQNYNYNYQGVNNRKSSSPRQRRSNAFEVVYEWRQIDFEYPSLSHRQQAIINGAFVPTNNLPLGVERWRDRLFVTTPRWKNGVPATLSVLPLPATDTNAPLRPYPSWDWHADPEASKPDCERLMSVYRLHIDECQRLWVLDAGVVNATISLNQLCPPKIVVFDLRTDRPIFAYELPADQVKEDSLHTNLIVDIRNGRCEDAYAYITDVWRNGITVFSLSYGRSWRTTNHFYLPNPTASDYTVGGLNFQWTDGVFGLSLTPLNDNKDRLLIFHPMSSFAVNNDVFILHIFIHVQLSYYISSGRSEQNYVEASVVHSRNIKLHQVKYQVVLSLPTNYYDNCQSFYSN